MLQAVGLLEGGFGGLDPRSPATRPRELDATGAPRCAATSSASSTSSITCCPISTRLENVVLPQLIHGAARAEAEARAATLLDRARPRPPADAPPEPALGRRAAARRGRPRARQPPGAGAGRRADRQPRRGDRRHRASPNSSGWCASEGSRGAGRDAQRAAGAQDGPRRAAARGPAGVTAGRCADAGRAACHAAPADARRSRRAAGCARRRRPVGPVLHRRARADHDRRLSRCSLAEQAMRRAMPFAVVDPRRGIDRRDALSADERGAPPAGDRRHRSIAPRVQRSGVNTEAKLLLLGHAFDMLGCECRADPHRLVQRAGRKLRSSGSAPSATACCAAIRSPPTGGCAISSSYRIIANEWPGVRRNLRRTCSREEAMTRSPISPC